MDLSASLAINFSRQDWQRGRVYARSGAVRLLKHDATSLYAQVQGSADEPYDVRLDWSNLDADELAVDCSCPRFADAGVCKHVAAVIQAADDAGVEIETDAQEPHDPWRAGGREAPLSSRKAAQRTKPDRQPQPPAWQQQLASVARAQIAQSSPAERARHGRGTHLQLQDQKRDLAAAIISADNSLLRNLTAEDLQLLLA